MHALQRLEQGALQRLGDAVLPWKFRELEGLRAEGLNAEGKTRKGVPDSFVGPSRDECTVAVEYTSQQDRLPDKLAADYAGVRKRCPHVNRIFLCTNRTVAEADRESLEALAVGDGIQLTIFDGIELVDVLAMERQDLRRDHLGIPLGAHSRATLLDAMRTRLDQRLPPRIKEALVRRALPQHAADGRLHVLAADSNSVAILVSALAGAGKSTWSARHALGRAEGQPAVWQSARDLPRSTDPITLSLVHAAFGASDPSRVLELAELLRREHLRAFVVLDAIDEVADLWDLVVALKDFRASGLGPHALLVMTCREEALPFVAEALRGWRSEVLDPKDGTLITLDLLGDREVEDFVLSEGATAEQARLVAGSMPGHLRGVPLFLRQALVLAKAGKDLDGDRAVESYAEFSVDDIRARMRERGRAPTAHRLRRVISEIALLAIASATDGVGADDVEAILGADGMVDGEDTLLGRARQAGLLESRANGTIGFQHALYVEYFAAQGLDSAWPKAPFPELATDAGKQIARRVAPFLQHPERLIEELMQADPAAACECAAVAGPLPKPLLTSLVGALTSALQSRFPSDQHRSLALLARVPGEEARAAAAAWWNALDVASRVASRLEAADAFLWLEMAGAFEVILGHRYFWPDHPWYEPSFVTRLRRTSPKFREGMITRALRELAKEEVPDARRRSVVTLLALFDDASFVEVLRARVDRGALLSKAELRALVHVNTTEAMEAYAGAADNVFAVSLEHEAGASLQDREQSSRVRQDSLVLRMGDIRMHPHDALIALAEDALSPPHASPVLRFGFRLAAFLGEERLLLHCLSASRRARSYLSAAAGSVEGILARCSPEEMVALYGRHEDERVRRQIVHHANQVPGHITEAFLVERVLRGEFVFDAVQALGHLRAYRAGSAILAAYRAADSEWLKMICLRALKMIRFAPAERSLCEALRRGTIDLDERNDDGDMISDALAWLGGQEAVTTLTEVFPNTRHQGAVLGALFTIAEPAGHRVAVALAIEHRVSATVLARALSSFDADDLNRKPPRGDLQDQALLDLLLTGADAIMESKDGLAKHSLIEAVGRFKLPAAEAFLKRVAWGATHEAWEAKTVLAALGDEGATRSLINDELRFDEAGNQLVTTFDSERLSAWPATIVRDELLRRIEEGSHVARWLFLLQWFAKPEDTPLFQAMEAGADVSAGDVAHQYLRGEKAFVLHRSRKSVESGQVRPSVD